MRLTYTLPTPASPGHQRTESTNTSCNQWLSLTKIAIEVPHDGRNRSLVACTNRCGEYIKLEQLEACQSPKSLKSPEGLITPVSSNTIHRHLRL